MKSTLSILALILWAYVGKAQVTTPLSLISPCGGIGTTTINSNNATVVWTMGETFINGGQIPNMLITVGEQQGSLDTATGISDATFGLVKVYPNPAQSHIQIDNLPAGENSITLSNNNGQVVQTFTATAPSVTLNTSTLPTAHYFLNISHDNHTHKTFKISITNH